MENKVKFALWIHPESLAKVNENFQKDDCRSKSEFIEKAVNFYCGFLAAKVYGDYIPNVIISTMKGVMASMEERIAKLLFKNAVEISMLSHLTAATTNISADTVESLREMCVKEVKKIHGTVNLEDAFRFQRRE